jgi:hypothetical protein
MGWQLGIEGAKLGKSNATIEFFSLLPLGEGPGDEGLDSGICFPCRLSSRRAVFQR